MNTSTLPGCAEAKGGRTVRSPKRRFVATSFRTTSSSPSLLGAYALHRREFEGSVQTSAAERSYSAQAALCV